MKPRRHKTPALDRIKQTIIDWIESGELKNSDPLPSEAAMAGECNASRGTVRKAYDELKAEGIISQRKGCGRVVTSGNGPSKLNALSNTILFLSKEQYALSPTQAIDTERLQHYPANDAADLAALSYCQHQGIHSLIIHPEQTNHQDILELISAGIGGILIFDSFQAEEVTKLLSKLKPGDTHTVINKSGPNVEAFDQVIPNHIEGTYMLVDWLVKKGCKRILPLWNKNSDNYWLQERNTGYQKAIKEFGLEPVNCLWPTGMDFTKAIWDSSQYDSITRAYLGVIAEHLCGKQTVDAILVHADWHVPFITAACEIVNKTPDKDVIIAGYDNLYSASPAWNWNPIPPAVTVDRNQNLVGEEMAKLLLARMRKEETGPQKLKMIEQTLIIPEMA